MARSLTSVIRDQITSDSVELAFLLKLRFDSGDLNIWTGIGDLTFSGDTYQGIGHLLSISEYKESQTLKAEGISFTLSGNIAASLATALTENYQDRVCTFWVGFFDSDVSPGLLNDPVILFQGRMGTMPIHHASEESTITLNAENVFVGLEHAVNRRYTPDDHNITAFTADNGQVIFDKGFNQVSILEDKEFFWGRKDPADLE